MTSFEGIEKGLDQTSKPEFDTTIIAKSLPQINDNKPTLRGVEISTENLKSEEPTQGQQATLALKRLLERVPEYFEEDWEEAYSRINYSVANREIPTKVMKICIVCELISYARTHGWHIAKDEGFAYIYSGTYWIVLEQDQFKQFLKEIAVQMGVAKHIALDVAFANDLYRQILHEGFFSEKVDIKDTLINVRNGTIWISDKGILLKCFDHKNFLTHQFNFDYDKNVKNNTWLSFLEVALPNVDTRKTLQQSLGYLLVQGLKLEKAVFLYGTGANGKSVIFEVLNGIFGSDAISNYSLEALSDEKGYHRAKIKNKLINYGTDINLRKIDPGVFKTLASGEPIEARLPYQEPFIMHQYAKLIFNLNRIDDANVEQTHGFFRRMLFIPFEVTIPQEEQDKDLYKKILRNKAGVLNWILEGTQEVIKNRDVFISEGCKNFLEQFRVESNSVIMFANEYILEGSNQDHIQHKVLYSLYREYCKGEGRQPYGSKRFSEELKLLRFLQIRRNTGIVWNLKLKG